VLGAKLVLAITSILFTLALTSVTVWSAMRARARGKEIEPAIDAAWMSIATDIAQQRKTPLTATDLAAALSIEEGQAEQLLALLDVNEIVRSDVTEEGEVAYSSRMRVEPAAVTERPTEPLAEQLAADEADAAGLETAKTMLADRGASKR